MSIFSGLLDRIKATVKALVEKIVGNLKVQIEGATGTSPGAGAGGSQTPGSAGSGTTTGGSVASAAAIYLAGPIPAPTNIPPGTLDSEGKHLGEEVAVPLTGNKPAAAPAGSGLAGQLQFSEGFLWKPIAGGTGKPVVYLPKALIGQIKGWDDWISSPQPIGRAVVVTDTAGKIVDAGLTHRGAYGDDGRPFFDCQKRRDQYPRRCWVVVTLTDGSRLHYPIFDARLRNGCGHGAAPPHLYPLAISAFSSSTGAVGAGTGGTPSSPPSHMAPAPATPFHGLMPTDWAVCKDLAGAYGSHFKTWRTAGIDTVHVVADLPLEDSRPHIGRGRSRTGPTPLLLANLAIMRNAGFRIILTAGNEPSVRRGAGHLMAVGATSVADCYTTERLQDEMAFWKALLAQFMPDAILLYLEPSHANAVPFQRNLAAYLRGLYQGPIYANGYGDGEWRGGESGVRWAPSLHSPAESLGQHVYNCDGMDGLVEGTAREWVPLICTAGAPDGWILWFDAYRGKGGPSPIQDWMWKHIAKPVAVAVATVSTAGMVQASGQRLVVNGKPWTMVADTAWLMTERIGGSHADMAAYLNKRMVQGFNAVMVGCNGSWFDRSVTRPVDEMFRRFDAILDAAAARCMYVVPAIQMHQYSNDKPVCLIPIGEARAVGAYYGARYRGRTCIPFWLVSGLDDKGVVSTADVMRQAEGVRSADPVHLITFHPAARKTSIDAFSVGPNHQIALYHSYMSLDESEQRTQLARVKAAGVPLGNIEGPFEGLSAIGAAEVARVAGWARSEGASLFAYGHWDVWQFAPGWQDKLYAPGVAAFMEAIR